MALRTIFTVWCLFASIQEDICSSEIYSFILDTVQLTVCVFSFPIERFWVPIAQKSTLTFQHAPKIPNRINSGYNAQKHKWQTLSTRKLYTMLKMHPLYLEPSSCLQTKCISILAEHKGSFRYAGWGTLLGSSASPDFYWLHHVQCHSAVLYGQ